MPVELKTWAAQIRAGEVRAVSRGISAIEDHDPQAEELLQLLFPVTGSAYLVGVTGAPGTGKSTLVDRLAAHYRALRRTVGIVAVDPTSPYSGGAILGDRIRMQGHAGDTGVFIRSMATRGFLGGLAGTTADVALLLDAAGKQMVMIETVGVGQDEIDVVRLADCTVVVLVPGMGDDVQSMKAGLMEVADIFVINKTDREGADRLVQQVAAMLQLTFLSRMVRGQRFLELPQPKERESRRWPKHRARFAVAATDGVRRTSLCHAAGTLEAEIDCHVGRTVAGARFGSS